jgi:hypothetical protein
MTTLVLLGLVLLGVVVIVLTVVVIGIVAVMVSKHTLHSMNGTLEARIAAQYGPAEILMKDLSANSFGQESLGVWQIRGNGGLVLTERELHFFLFLPKRDLLIPLDSITEITFTKCHLGKATIYNLLKVRFVVDGKSDSIAWYVSDPQAWKDRIEEAKVSGENRVRLIGHAP